MANLQQLCYCLHFYSTEKNIKILKISVGLIEMVQKILFNLFIAIDNVFSLHFLQHMKSVLECLSQLHGTGFAYKKSAGGKQRLLQEFPKLEVQIQLKVCTGSGTTENIISPWENIITFWPYKYLL